MAKTNADFERECLDREMETGWAIEREKRARVAAGLPAIQRRTLVLADPNTGAHATAKRQHRGMYLLTIERAGGHDFVPVTRVLLKQVLRSGTRITGRIF